ncbi:UDP-N-acetylglucosamine 2-epimerase (non-hydrolyzing) [soil metagenome]
MKIVSVVGARPNFVKVAALHRAILAHNERGDSPLIEHVLIHTGQHHDPAMTAGFFDGENALKPRHFLGIAGGSHADQVGRTMSAIEAPLLAERPDWVVVVGDVNSTMAAALVAKKLLIKVAHVESGLRSGDWTMPEEINRIVTDRISDLLLCNTERARANLLAEGVEAWRTEVTGNVMIDTLDANVDAIMMDPSQIVRRAAIDGQDAPETLPRELGIITLHRPGSVDDAGKLFETLQTILSFHDDFVFVYPIHPRVAAVFKQTDHLNQLLADPRIIVTPPLPYRELLNLNAHARIVVTDSGGLQEECMIWGTPCVTLRPNTERPETLVENGGTSVLSSAIPEELHAAMRQMASRDRSRFRPPLWDGESADRVLEAMVWRKDDAARGTEAGA